MSAIPLGGGATDADAYAPCAGRVVPPRAHLTSDAPRLDLCGEWDFELVVGESRRSGRMAVPSALGARRGRRVGSSRVHQRAVPVPRRPAVRPGRQPDRYVPAGALEVPDAWTARQVAILLRLLGAESEAHVVVNDVPVGMTRGSRLTREFDVTGVGPGRVRTTVEITVRQWSPGSYLEDQDQWWLPGIFREVELLWRPAGGIEDVWLDADYDPDTGRGSVRTSRSIAPGAEVRVSIPELGVDATLRAGRRRSDRGRRRRSSRGAPSRRACTTRRWPRRPRRCRSASGSDARRSWTVRGC